MSGLLCGLGGGRGKERPVHAVIQGSAWDPSGSEHIGAAFGGNATNLEPVLNMLAKHTVADSISKASWASSEFVHRLLDACSLFHRSPDFAK